MGVKRKSLFKRASAMALAMFMTISMLPFGTNLVNAKISDAEVNAGEVVATAGNATLTAVQKLAVTAKDTPISLDGTDYTYTLKSSSVNNAKVGSSTARVHSVITATKDANVALLMNMGSGKKAYVIESDTNLNVLSDASAPVTMSEAQSILALEEGNHKYNLKISAGKFYYIVGVGTNLELIDFVEGEAVPEAGEKYSLEFYNLSDQSKLNGYVSDDGYFKVISEANTAYYHDGQHGAAVKNGDKVTVKVAGSATITLSLCQYGSGTAFVVTDADGNKVGSVAGETTTDGNTEKISYTGDATTLTITCEATGEAYLHSISVENLVVSGNAVDFIYILDEYKTAGGYVKTGEVKIGDSTLLLAGQTVDGVITQFTVKDNKKVMINGVEHDSYTSGKRHADSNNIPTLPGEGDGCLAVFTPAAKGMVTVYYNSTSFIRVHDFNADGTKNGFTDSDVGLTSYSFEVYPGHSYVMSTTGKTNNMFYAAFAFVPDMVANVNVTVTNVDATVGDSLKLTLTDASLGGDPITVKLTDTTIRLLKGHTYKIESNDGGVKPLANGSETFLAGAGDVAITLNNVPDVVLSGKITGTDVSNVTSLTFTNNANGLTYNATITGDGYSLELKPGEYSASVVTTNGGVTYDRASVVTGQDNTDDVYVEVVDATKKHTYSYTDIPNMETTGNVAVETGKSHTVAKADATIKIPVSGKAKVIVSAYYLAEFTMNGSYCVVDSKTTSKIDTFEMVTEKDVTLAFSATSYITSIEVIPIVEFKSELNVPGDYDTLNEASDAILGMLNRPAGEAGRVTINLKTDIFEQTVMAADYVTLKGNNHTISWYYGVGTLYYSVDPGTGLYNKRLAMDKYSSAEGNGSLWGGVFIARGDNFIAEDVTFLNTYNYTLTEAEKSDIAGTLLAVDRLADGADVTAYKYKERSNAFYVDADNLELYNCKILSSQDTFGRNGSTNYNYHVYVKDSVIGGNTDYICGEFSAIFDNCELQWKTFANDASNNSKIGYIVAPKTSPYVFRNCTITTDGAHGSDPAIGKYGRTWGANSNASFINCETNGLVDSEGWGEMSAGDKVTAVFNEFGNTSNGAAFTTTGATNTDILSVNSYIDGGTVRAFNTVLAGWRPVHYLSDATTPKTGDNDVIFAILGITSILSGLALLFTKKIR